MSSETFEQVLTAAQAAGSITPAWKKFVNTKFFVAIVRSADNDPKNFTLHLQDDGGKPAVTISELRERLDAQPGSALVALSGAEVVRRLQAEASILVALSDRAFAIAKDRVDWLKKGIEAAQARAAEKAQQAAGGFPALDKAPAPVPVAAPVAAAPAPVMLAKPPAAPAPAAPSPVQRNQVGVLDVAALKPRSVTLPKIGLEFFVPASWTESPTTTGLRFADAERRTTVEASGFQRPNLSMAQWMEMRTTLVRHEMRYLVQDGESYPFEGEGWRSRVKGMATEFTGTFPGDEFESRYLVACIWTDGVLASITVRAPADAFEQNRALYKWLLSRVDMNESAAAVYSPPGSSLGAAESDYGDGEAPPMFGFSLAGRMSRMRVLAYSFPVMLVLALVGILAAVLVPANRVLGVAVLAVGMPAGLWFGIRLMVLRMHDVNLSGKWLAGFIGLLVLAGVLRNEKMLVAVFVIFWLASFVIYCFIPGTDGDNDFGEAPGPNSTLVNIGATLFILAQFGQIGAAGSGKYSDRMPFPSQRGGADVKASTAFSPPGSAFSVMLPGVPEKIELPQAVVSQLSEVELQQYQLSAGGHVYMVQTIDYRDRMPDNRFDTMDAMQESVLGRDGTLVESSPILLEGGSGRQVKVSTPGGGMRAARFAVVGSQVYVASIHVQNAEKGAAAVAAFLDSFKLN